jgi:aminoglycoside phosphotransferase (APT) family kinase protein
MYRVEVRGQPASVPRELVFRLAPDRPMGAKEAAVQRIVAELGYPTPAVRLVGSDGHLDGVWSVMDFATGTPPLGNLDGLAALRNGPGLFARLPVQLAETMTELHALDPVPVTAAVREAAPTVAWSIDELLDAYGDGAEALGRDDLVAAVDALRHGRPEEECVVICHGDLHPFNLLIDDDRHLTVIDWTAAIRAAPAYDVAFTAMLLANPPLAAPGPLGAVLRFVGTRIANRFIASYGRLAPDSDLGQLDWYRALHGVRLILTALSHEDRHGPFDADHPFGALVPAAVSAITVTTHVPIERPRLAAS